MKKSQKFIHQFYYTIQLLKMQLNLKNISNIFQILKGADLSQVAPYLKTGIFEFKTNFICVCRADSTQDNIQDNHISRSSVVVHTRKLGLQYEVPVFHIRIITQMFCQVIVILLPISRHHFAKSVPSFCHNQRLSTRESPCLFPLFN